MMKKELLIIKAIRDKIDTLAVLLSYNDDMEIYYNYSRYLSLYFDLLCERYTYKRVVELVENNYKGDLLKAVSDSFIESLEDTLHD